MLFTYKLSKVVWRHSSFGLDLSSLHALSVADIIHILVPSFSDSQLEIMIGIMWTIWGERNRRFHNEQPCDPNVLFEWFEAYLE